jgi:hypothetical protein
MSELASPITTAPSRPDDYAPPARRMEKLGELAPRITTVAGRPRATGAPHGEAW